MIYAAKAAWLHAVVNQKQDFSFAFLYVKLWLGWWDSNPRIKESKSFALPLGYIPIKMVLGEGLEPSWISPPHFECGASANSANQAYKVVPPAGIEPAHYL